MVSVFAIGDEVLGVKPGRGRRISKTIKIRSTTFFRREVKPPIPYRKMLRHVENP
jgi:hypothetical protein